MDSLSPTKLALELLIQLQDELVAYLSALRLLGEEKTVEELEGELIPVFGLVAARYAELSGNVDVAGANFAQADREFVLAQSHQETEGNRYESIVALRDGLQESVSGLVAQKGNLEASFAQEIVPIESRIEEIYQNIQTTTVEYNNATDAGIKEGILGTLNGYYVQLQQEQNLLSVRSADYQHDLEVLDFQIDEATAQLEEIETNTLPEQETALNEAETRLQEVQSEWESWQGIKEAVEGELAGFVAENWYLFAEVVEEIEVTEATPELLRLQQELTTVKDLEINQERLISLQSQDNKEESVAVALDGDTVEDYKVLLRDLKGETQGLIDIWVGNLEETNAQTIAVWDLQQSHSESFDNLATYIEENLADPDGAYFLNQIQLEEKIKLYDSQVQYRDSLVVTVEDIEGAISFLNVQVEQVEELSQELEDITELTELEKQYAALQSAYAELEELRNYEINPERFASNFDAGAETIKNELFDKLDNIALKIASTNLLSENDLDSLTNYIEKAKGKIIEKTTEVERIFSFGKALSFDGVNAHTTNSTSLFKNISDTFTIEFWVNPTATRPTTPELNIASHWRQLIAGWESGQRYAIVPITGDILGSGHVGVGVSVGTNGVSVFEHRGYYLPSPLVHNTNLSGWNHIAVVYENKTPSLYINGEYIKTGITSWHIPHPSAFLGKLTDRDVFKGELDEVRIWNIARTEAEILENYNQQLAGDEAGLAGYWNFDEAVGYVINDVTDNNNNGEIKGASRILGISADAADINPVEAINFSEIQSLFIDESAESLRPLLIERLDQEITENIQEIPIQIELEEQEEFVETTLSEYIEEQHSEIIETKERHLGVIGEEVRPSRALYFDGVNDYVQVGAKSSLVVSDSFTLEAWIKPVNQGGEFGTIIDKEGEYVIARLPDGTIRWALPGINWGVGWINTGYVAPDGEWNHIALSYDKNAIKFYANGNLIQSYDASVTIGDYFPDWNDFRIGGKQAYANNKYFRGEIDEVRVWNTTRTQGEIQTYLNQVLTGEEAGLVGYWDFEEESGNTVLDLTDNNNHGTLNGTQRTVENDNYITENENPITRPIGKALYFDGVNDSIQIEHNPSFHFEAGFTIQAWIKTESVNGTIVAQYECGNTCISGVSNSVFNLYVNNTGQAAFLVRDTQGNSYTVTSSETVIDGQWHHLTGTRDLNDGTLKIYIDGVFQDASNAPTGVIQDNDNSVDPVTIGGQFQPGSSYLHKRFQGEIDEVRVWDLTKTQEEIQADFDQVLTGEEEGLVSYWNFEEESGDTVQDLTDNNNYGTLHGTQRTIENENPITRPEGKALFFDGVNDHVTNTTLFNDVSDTFTLEFWVKPTATRPTTPQSNSGTSGYLSGQKYAIVPRQGDIFGSGHVAAGVSVGTNGIGVFEHRSYYLPSPLVHNTNLSDWNHIAIVYNNKTPSLYLNGEYIKTGITSNYVVHPSAVLGKLTDRDIFQGELDEVRIWNVARTQAEIQQNLSETLTGEEARLVGYWNFEEESGEQVFDLTDNNNHGTLNGTQRTIEVAVAQEIAKKIKNIEETAIADLQSLRLETTYLTTLAEKEPETVQAYLEEYQNSDQTEAAIATLREKYFPGLSEATTLSSLQQEIGDELNQSQQELDQLEASIANKEAEAAAAFSQADWYEEQAGIHWELSRKQGRTWTEVRWVKKKKWNGNIKHEPIAIHHLDHHWILWDNYTKYAASLRKNANNLLEGKEVDIVEKDLVTEIINQWNVASSLADEAELTYQEFVNLLQQLEAERELTTVQRDQLAAFETLLPTLKQQLQDAQQAATEAKANLDQEWQEYQTSGDTYQTALNDVLQRGAQLKGESLEIQQEIAEVKHWVEQQSIALDTEIQEVTNLKEQLQSQLDEIKSLLFPAEGEQQLSPEEFSQLATKQVLVEEAIQILTHKETILTNHQATLSQKLTLLAAQEDVIESESALLEAYLASPDDDFSNLENQLQDSRETLAQVRQLAEQAEANSEALTQAVGELSAHLLQQNDQYLAEIKNKQEILQDLIAATELKENYTVQGVEKQQELNSLENQLFPVLEQATDAGSQEAALLLEVAHNQDMGTAAEIYYRDYRDLASDTGGSCAGGVARPEDIQLADFYYEEWQKYQELQSLAQEQASHFASVRAAAEAQIDLIESQQAIAAQELADIQDSIGDTEDTIDELEQELAIAQYRVDTLAHLRDWTEQTSIQLLQVEQLNLAQANLVQEIATNRDEEIDEAIAARLEREQLDIDRQRQIAIAKLEQLNQLQTEQALQDSLNDLRTDLGLNPIEDIIRLAEWKGQLAGILVDLSAFQAEVGLPAELQTLLSQTNQDIERILEGEEVATIQDNLLNTATSLIEQANEVNSAIAQLEQEEQQNYNLLQLAETDLQAATKQLYDEIIESQQLGEQTEEINQEYLEVLYSIGYAEGAIDFSSELAQQSKDILNQIIEGRIQQRKARKKAFINEVFGTITLVLSTVALVATAGASLAAGALTQTALSATLSSISAGLSAVQAAYNGDWSNALFNAGMAVISGITADLKFSEAAIQASETIEAAEKVREIEALGQQIQKYQNIRNVASGLYYGYQAAEAGDNLTAALNVISAGFTFSEYNYLAQAGLSIHNGVQLAEENDWLAATSSFLAGAFALGEGLDGGEGSFGIDLDVSNEVLDIISTVELAVNIADGVQTISEDGSLEGWLSGIQGIANGVSTYLQQQKQIGGDDTSDDSNGETDNNTGGDDTSDDSNTENPNLDNDNANQSQKDYIVNPDKIEELYEENNLEKLNREELINFFQKEYENHKDNYDVGFYHQMLILAEDSPQNNFIDYVLNFSRNQIIQENNSPQTLRDQALNTTLYGIDLLTDLGDSALDGLDWILETATFGFYESSLDQITFVDEYDLGATFKGRNHFANHLEPAFREYISLVITEAFENNSDPQNIARAIEYIRNEHNPLLTEAVIPGFEIVANSGEISSLGILGIHGQSIAQRFVPAFAVRSREIMIEEIIQQQVEQRNLNIDKYQYTQPSTLKFLGKSIYDNLEDAVKELTNSDAQIIDPIVIDLDNDGIKLIGTINSFTLFDMDADGYVENTAWVSPKDGILTIDLNQDGTINNITEIFSEHYDDGTANSGLEALATLDSNNNGIISAADNQFKDIFIWQDSNQNGISEADELKTLTEHGITSINLNGIADEIIQDGNIIRTRSLFNRIDGTSGEISDVAFLVTQTGFKVNQTDTGIEIIAEDDSAISLFIHQQETGLTLNLADAGVQVAIGNIGNDNLFTTGSEDVFLSGEAGDDTLTGGDGNDWLVGNEGADSLSGGAGDDLFYIDAADTFIDGGTGTDIVIVSTPEGVTLDLEIANIEMALGNEGDDTFTNSGTETVVMDGGEGNDQLTGGDNDDIITGGAGEDTITGNGGADILSGGPDADTFIFTAVEDSTTANPDVIEDFEPGRDRIDLTALGYTSLDSLTITQNSDTTTISANADNFSLILNDELTLTAGDFSFDTNDNTLEGTEGDDTLNGTVGDDTINGKGGNDKLIGKAGNDTLIGASGKDTIDGKGGNDKLIGQGGNDTLDGGGHNDILIGGGGNDTLVGNWGQDTITGGIGRDRISFNNPNHGTDTITDFTSAEDIIAISASGFGGDLTPGTLNPNQLILGTVPDNNSEYRFRYDTNTGGLFYDADGSNTDFSQRQLAILSGTPTLAATDILVI